MQMINVTVWTVMQGTEDSAFLRDLNVDRARAKATFEAAVTEIDDTSLRLLPGEGLEAGNGCDWVRLESRPMTVALSELVQAIAEASAHPVASA